MFYPRVEAILTDKSFVFSLSDGEPKNPRMINNIEIPIDSLEGLDRASFFNYANLKGPILPYGDSGFIILNHGQIELLIVDIDDKAITIVYRDGVDSGTYVAKDELNLFIHLVAVLEGNM